MNRLPKRPLQDYRMLGLLFACGLLWLSVSLAERQPYDPLVLPTPASPAIVNLTVRDTRRQRDLPVRVYLPRAKIPAPLILYSPGLGGSREGNRYLGDHWARRGYAVAFLQHPGTDRSGRPGRVGNYQNLLLRIGDVPAVLDQLERWNQLDGHVLAGRLDAARVGIAGHSFGAMTAQAVTGQQFEKGKSTFTDTRLSAALILSPTAPKGDGTKSAFGKVSIPWLLMTGTRDTAHVERRLAVYPALPVGSKYELVLHGARHAAFTDEALPAQAEPRNPKHHRVILALSTAFWDAYLGQSGDALEWLNGNGPGSILDQRDRWQFK